MDSVLDGYDFSELSDDEIARRSGVFMTAVVAYRSRLEARNTSWGRMLEDASSIPPETKVRTGRKKKVALSVGMAKSCPRCGKQVSEAEIGAVFGYRKITIGGVKVPRPQSQCKSCRSRSRKARS